MEMLLVAVVGLLVVLIGLVIYVFFCPSVYT
jgi:hypothetical protein